MPNPYRHLFDQSNYQLTERTKAGAHVRLGEVEIMDLQDKREESTKAHELEQRDAIAKLKEIIRKNPGIDRDEISLAGGYQKFPEKELKLLKQIKAIEWRKNGYFIREIKPE